MALPKLPLMGLLLLLTLVVSPTTAVDDPICLMTTSKLSRASFPEGFLFGTATAAFQVEGAIYETNRGPALWDVYCRKFPERCNHDNADVAVDFFHRYKEDIQLMKSLNTDSFRLSIAWSRIFPYGRKENGVSQAGVQFYHDLIDELLKNGIIPFVTVFHWDTPQVLEDEYGGFLNENIVKDFRAYADFVFQEYGKKVKNWITFNEPWVFAHAGYDIGKKAPGRCSKYIKSEFPPCKEGQSGYEAYKVRDGKIGMAHSPAWFEPHDFADAADGASVERALQFMMGWHLDATTFGDYPQIMKDIVGDRLPRFTDQEKRKLKDSTDFVGLNYYTAIFSNHMDQTIPSEPRFLQDSLIHWENKNAYDYNIGSKPLTAALNVYSR